MYTLEITSFPNIGRAGQILPSPLQATFRDVDEYSHQPRRIRNQYTAHWCIVDCKTEQVVQMTEEKFLCQDDVIGVLNQSETEINYSWDGRIIIDEAGTYKIRIHMIHRAWDEAQKIPDMDPRMALMGLDLVTSTGPIEIEENHEAEALTQTFANMRLE